MSISFAITAYNEHEELQVLLNQLEQIAKPDDEIVIQLDSKATPEVLSLVDQFISKDFTFTVKKCVFDLNNHFADFKNNLKSYCTKDWVFQIDADETLSETFSRVIHEVLDANDGIDLIAVPRVNIVKGLEQNDIIQWHWQVNSQGWVNWPDPQHRIFRNKPEVKWVNKVHEKIVGWKTYAELPSEDDSYALYHIKDIDRQRKQNEFYSQI
jgi:glycosyltransferase involved in cell wall biosynthesis|tara:strand:- start:1795 stop:2427 length:633 start_codon:yes stop_codon:yes gene_type:complete